MFQSMRPIRHVWSVFKGEQAANQIAWAVALGMLIGLVPKGNLTAGIFGMLLLATRVNLGAGLLTAAIFTNLSSLIDPLTHAIGLRLLSQEPIQRLFVAWHDLPLVPWLALNNTVVLGSVVVGLALLYPVRHLTGHCVEAIQARWRKKETHRINTPELDLVVSQALQDIAATRAASTEPQGQA